MSTTPNFSPNAMMEMDPGPMYILRLCAFRGSVPKDGVVPNSSSSIMQELEDMPKIDSQKTKFQGIIIVSVEEALAVRCAAEARNAI